MNKTKELMKITAWSVLAVVMMFGVIELLKAIVVRFF